jgi:hypothetical protein
VRQRTSADLRETLWETIEGVKNGDISAASARAVSELADKILDTVEAELRYSEGLARLDASDSGISTGPLLLTESDAKQ